MSLAPGRRLGPYEIVSPIGSGGMGEVFRARDTRLSREVAVKVLPAGLAGNDQFRARFEREAKVISRLSHPHICTLFDVGLEGDTHFLVMELLEGESLAERLKRAPLPLDQVLKLGQQISSALDAAHRQGIVHRDLKPGNVMLTKSGAKLLDFGLARNAGEGRAPLDGLSAKPTEEKPLTVEGTILGTFQYMAPEQLEGREADARTDIFALGAVLYEMATGRRAFEGPSKTTLIAAIVSSQPPPISTLVPVAPPALDHVARKCLEKDPDDRWQSAQDVAGELAWISQAGSQAGVAAPVAMRRRTRERLAWSLAAAGWILAISGLVGAARERAARDEATRPVRSELVIAEAADLLPVQQGAIALAPDGSRIVMQSRMGLRVRALGTGETTALSGTESATFPFWSPDGQWIGFFADGRLKKVAAGGGPVQILAEAPQGRGGSWSRSGEIVFAPDIRGPLMKVAAAGGTPAALTKPEGEGRTHRNPHILPDGRHVLYISRESRSQEFGSIVATPLAGGAETLLVERGSNPQFAKGRLFWVRDGNLLAQPFDPSSLTLSSDPTPLADGIEYYNPRDIGNFSVSGGGSLAWRRERADLRRVVRLGLGGRQVEPLGEPGLLALRDVSPDGRRVLLERRDASRGGFDLWVLEVDGGRMIRVTFGSGERESYGAFSPDGQRLAVSFPSGRGWASGGLGIQLASGGGAEQRLLEGMRFYVRDWSPDGRTLVGDVQETVTVRDIAYLSLDEPKNVRKFLATPFYESPIELSPDGRWLAYVSNESGELEMYVGDFPEGRRKWQVSKGATVVGSWSPKGDALYYADAERRVVEVPLRSTGDSLEIGTPRTLDLRVSAEFAVTARGLLTLEPVAQGGPEPIRLVRHWERLLGK